MECQVCGEAAVLTANGWVHAHGDVYCGTGDGSTAYPRGRWLFGVLAERDGKTRAWTIETTLEAAEAAVDEVPAEYSNPRVAKRWESEWIEP